MIEKVYELTKSHEKVLEKVLIDNHINYMHVILPAKDKIPEHFSNANLYITVLKGALTIQLNDQNITEYQANTVINVPYNTKMIMSNNNDEILELIILKTPIPGEYYSK